jgi:ABC-type Fe3+-hydroxamate transport system substrate-binding protein
VAASMPVPGVSTPRLLVCIAVAALVFIAACGDDSGSSGEGTSSRESDVYAAIVVAVAADEPHDEETKPIVYVSPFPNEKAIPLDVQVSVVDSVADDAVVRFVDKEEQAINKSSDNQSVIDDGVLVRVGPVPEDGTTVTVPAELYHDENTIMPTEFKVTQGSDGSWVATQQSTASG